jgi:hypothetical protein
MLASGCRKEPKVGIGAMTLGLMGTSGSGKPKLGVGGPASGGVKVFDQLAGIKASGCGKILV